MDTASSSRAVPGNRQLTGATAYYGHLQKYDSVDASLNFASAEGAFTSKSSFKPQPRRTSTHPFDPKLIAFTEDSMDERVLNLDEAELELAAKNALKYRANPSAAACCTIS